MKGRINSYTKIALLLMVFITVVIGATMSLQQQFGLSDAAAGAIVNIMSTFLGAVLGGTFTLLAVDRTIGKQNDIQFINEFPSKVRMLDEMLTELEEFQTKLTKKNAPFLIVDKNC